MGRHEYQTASIESLYLGYVTHSQSGTKAALLNVLGSFSKATRVNVKAKKLVTTSNKNKPPNKLNNDDIIKLASAVSDVIVIGVVSEVAQQTKRATYLFTFIDDFVIGRLRSLYMAS